MSSLRVGIIGVGNISGIYFENLGKFEDVEVVACADLDVERAKSAAAKHGIGVGLTPEALLAHPDVDLVLNLTIPNAHADVAFAAVEAGKHVYNEKPLAIALEDGVRLIELADKHGVLVGGAPDTFLGGAHQTCRQLLDDGAIGQPVSIDGFMLCGGHESWHPNPEFYYKVGGGPLFDMGPYYLTAFVNLLGPVKQVAGYATTTFAQRTITSEPLKGTIINVDTPTHISALLEFAGGVSGTLTTSFDVPVGVFPHIVLAGTEGTMVIPDPNGFGGEIKLKTRSDSDWRTITSDLPYQENSRGLGVKDLGDALRQSRAPRASGALALHVLETMHAVLRSSDNKAFVELKTTVERPKPL